VADPPHVWQGLGFAVKGNLCSVEGVVHVLAGSSDRDGRGIRSWTVDGLMVPDDGRIDGLDTVAEEPVSGDDIFAGGAAGHPNGVTAIDHLVVATPDLDRTVRALEATGLQLRRTRDGEAYGNRMRQAFFKLGPVVLEVAGPPTPMGEGPARFFGIAFTVADLDATAALLGSRLHPAKDAVQPGRRIATLGKEAGSSTGIAFMSPGAVEYA
jgi:hypothetical protein